MSIFKNKKIVLSFYSYASIVVLTVFFVTSLCVHILPTNYFVKFLVFLSGVSFFAASLIYMITESAKKPVIILFLVTMILGVAYAFYTSENRNEPKLLVSNYIKEIRKYDGAEYRKGFEIRHRIDDIGLMHAPMWQSMLKNGIINLNFPLILKSNYYWWHTPVFDSLVSETDSRFQRKPVGEKYYKGDICADIEKRQIYIYLGNDEWITSQEKKGVTVYKSGEIDTVLKNGSFYEWKLIAESYGG